MTAAQPRPTWTVERTVGVPTAAALEEVLGLTHAAADADGNPPLSEQTLVTLRAAGSADRVILFSARSTDRPEDQDLTGVAVVVRDAEGAVLELVVAPDCRGEGVGTALVEAVLAEGVAGLRAWSHGNHAAAATLAERSGLTAVRELWRMRLTRTAGEQQLPAVTLPEGVRLRPFVRGQDEEAWLAANAAAFVSHAEQGATTRADLEARMDEDWFDAEGFLLAVDAHDTLLGFHWTKVHPGEDGHASMGEVYVVGVTPEAQGTGLGRALTIAGIEYLHGRGLPSIMLYVDADNTAAVALYQKLGFIRWDVDVMYADGAAAPAL